ncbi:PREDICTED: dehydrogenase/reductase SDR family member 7-like [Amphimedon queenslandica]|uniref:Ketoreductase domain-containing protein n=1 Tax=Amphimedon queenslandica TaxID=400682 RepID=A0A1X7UST8_AMPQE|nr:PREDICTED: dehydrogenase/reductase SDR family member 7-like [Amphimedon queenslandica]|eukprot:XP_003386866.1 PREDICTED: dehydrogenase/reductase SDR family member 7-like [Amphimedon queenslandica]
MDALTIVVSVLIALTVYLFIKFLRADADLTLLRCSLKRNFFKDKVVWVTGASSGIGEELCRQLSTEGAKLILSARSMDKLNALLKSLAHPENARAYYLDISDRESVRRAPKEVQSLFDKVDILINNAGISMRCTFLDIEEDTARKVMEVDLLGTSFLTKGVIKTFMLQQGGGHVVNVSSISGKFGAPTRSYYCASKFGLNGLMDVVRLELLDKNICVTNVCPGPVKTAVSENAMNPGGSLHGKKDPMIENGMKVERCAELILIAVSNGLHEVWISHHPYLLMTYLSQWSPSLFHFLMKMYRRKN